MIKALFDEIIKERKRGGAKDFFIANNRANRRKLGMVNAHKNKPRNIASRKPKR